jgi:hypothetical protein
MIKYSKQATTCQNSFPKIFGGSVGYSELYQIDVFKDYLAMVGYTSDSKLKKGSSSEPVIAVASVTIPDEYYWAKVLILKKGVLLAV